MSTGNIEHNRWYKEFKTVFAGMFKKGGNLVAVRRLKQPKRLWNKIVRIGTYLLLFDMAFIFLFPFLFMLVTSLKSNAHLNDFTVNWVPPELKFENYIIAFRALKYGTFFINSVFITVVASIGHLLTCSFIGYGFTRYEFPLKRVLFFIVIIVFIVPVQTLIVPMYILYSNLKWLNSYLPILVPTFFGFGLKGALFIFIFCQFYLRLPPDLENAAKIDGCGFLRTYWNIALPIVQSAFLVVLVLSLVWHWNDFYEPSIYVTNPALATLPARLNAMVQMVNSPPEDLFSEIVLKEGESSLNNAVLMAGTFMVVLPIIICFGFLQKKFMQGIERTGLTGE